MHFAQLLSIIDSLDPTLLLSATFCWVVSSRSRTKRAVALIEAVARGDAEWSITFERRPVTQTPPRARDAARNRSVSRTTMRLTLMSASRPPETPTDRPSAWRVDS